MAGGAHSADCAPEITPTRNRHESRVYDGNERRMEHSSRMPQAQEDASGTRSEGKVPKRRHSTIGTFRKGGQRSKSIGRTKYTPLVSESRGEQTEETPPTSVENVEWPMLLELLLGPNRSTNHHGLKSTEQKLKRFPRSSMVADSAVSATRGYHSHMGPVPCGTPPCEDRSDIADISGGFKLVVVRDIRDGSE